MRPQDQHAKDTSMTDVTSSLRGDGFYSAVLYNFPKI